MPSFLRSKNNFVVFDVSENIPRVFLLIVNHITSSKTEENLDFNLPKNTQPLWIKEESQSETTKRKSEILYWIPEQKKDLNETVDENLNKVYQETIVWLSIVLIIELQLCKM